ncbi:hypothetical protein K9O30_18335 [Clostridium bowmanii]|uniref:hypothetical protein n=1 Tax=Clostridium bowmanii TaxID=132925 RepID=UPI001C0CD91B|nr:hypothetical protein [Clostridium bowmanii]MBU3191197.1 hypothetical protein [Clostridium bowmanii]MCA1075645.1 hypothetical protein [Clostridium bowmanii]
MEMKGNKKSLKNSTNGVSDFLLTISSNDSGGVHGKIQHCESCETKDFRSLIEMILLINGKLDGLEIQNPTNQIRSWAIRRVPLSQKEDSVL